MVKMILFLVMAFAQIAALAQTHVAISTRTAVTADKLTLQVDPANQTRAQVCAVVINATSAGSVTIEHSGTAATTTVVTPPPVSPGGRAAKIKAYSNSNVGSGTAISPAYKFAANVPFPILMKSVNLAGNGTTKNVTIVIALDASGDVSTGAFFSEDSKCEEQ
jgi:hypothetical protein